MGKGLGEQESPLRRGRLQLYVTERARKMLLFAAEPYLKC
jgi:hypothetical protein